MPSYHGDMTTWLLLVALAQQPTPPDKPAILAAMKEVSFLVGEWEGEGWKLIAGKREPSKVSERVQWQAGGTILSINGHGKNSEGATVHEAYGGMFFDLKTKEYRLRTFLSDGNTGDFKAEAKDGVITWHLPSTRPIRYTIRLDDKGRWFEVGEVNPSGDTWLKFMELRLTRKK